MQNGRVGYDSTLYHPSNFGIGFDDPSKNIIDPSALIEMQADDKGLLIPRMTADQMTAIAQPANSLLVYNTTDSIFNYYDEKSDSWQELSKGDIWVEAENHNVILFPEFNFVGLGTKNPQTKIHLFTDEEHIYSGFGPPTIRLESGLKKEVFAWDIAHNNKNLLLKYGTEKNTPQVSKTETKFVFTDECFLGIGTDKPMANVHINNYNKKAPSNKSNIILESYRKEPIFFEIANQNGTINFNYNTQGTKTSILNYNPNSQKLNLLNSNCTIDNEGTVEATKFIANGVDISKATWTSNGSDIYYDAGNVGIGNVPTPNTHLHIYQNGTTTNDFSNFPTISLDYENTPTSVHGNWKIYSYYDEGFGLGVTTNDNPDDVTIRFTESGSIIFKGGISNSKFAVSEEGHVSAQYVKIMQTSSKDYVFHPEYDLISIDSLSNFVETNHHLPEIPSEQEIIDNNGIELGEFSIDLLGKIEELTLYIIELNERIDKLENENKALKNE